MPRSRSAPRLAACFGVSFAALFTMPAPSAGAQVELGTHIGLFTPLGDVLRLAPDSGLFAGLRATEAHEKALAVGARLTVWWSDAWALEATTTYVPSGLERLDGVFEGSLEDAHVVVTSARVVRRFRSVEKLSFQAAAGIGLFVRGGNAYSNVDGTTDLSFAWGGGVRVALAPAITLRWDLEGHTYSGRFDVTMCTNTGINTVVIECERVDTERRLQHDLLVLQTVVVALGEL